MIQSSCLPTQSFGTVQNRMQTCVALKLLPIFLTKPAARHRAPGASKKQPLLLAVFSNLASLVSTNNHVQKERWGSMNVLLWGKDNDELRILTQPLYTFPVAQRGCRVLEISPSRLLLVQRFPHFQQLFWAAAMIHRGLWQQSNSELPT